MDNDTTAAGAGSESPDRTPPPLPPRRTHLPDRLPSHNADPSKLQSKPTTALSSIDIQTLSFPDGSRGTFSTTGTKTATTPVQEDPSGHGSPRVPGLVTSNSEMSDSMSVMSFAPTLRPPQDLASLVTEEFHKKSRAWQLLRSQSASVQPFQTSRSAKTADMAEYKREFDEVPELSADNTDERRLALWKAKLKHYMILSSAGKPIWSRHGDTSLINSYMGVVQTIISFYEGAKNPLLGFTAGHARFVVATEGPLYFVAISRLGESDAQLRDQLKALYMQILSTLTLPALTSIFANRPSTDLRKPLQGTESLLSSLADSFTKGSPSALLSALECLKLRKSQRHSINNAFLKQRSDKLLYGLIVAGGKLVSVIRPRKHSLHPSDLQLIFNMLFESGSIQAGGGESWIPLCLPAFNNRGYLYMYVSFFDQASTGSQPPGTAAPTPEESIAIILISADKESFFELKDMRDKVASQLRKQGHLRTIRAAVEDGRPLVTNIVPGTPISHFMYKSRANVQFAMAALEPYFGEKGKPDMLARRRLMTVYHQVHASVHAKHSHLKILHCEGSEANSLAWITPIFEFYCVAGPNASRALIIQGANKIVQWAKREEERLFIIGGGVF